MEPARIRVLCYALGEPVGASVRGCDIGNFAEVFAGESLNRNQFARTVNARLKDDILMHSRFEISRKSEDKNRNH